jgi:hypothetical protein
MLMSLIVAIMPVRSLVYTKENPDARTGQHRARVKITAGGYDFASTSFTVQG